MSYVDGMLLEQDRQGFAPTPHFFFEKKKQKTLKF